MTTTTAKRAKYSVDQMTEGEILVRGTRDPHEALKIFFEIAEDEFEDRLYGVERKTVGHEYDDDYEVTPERVTEFANKLHAMLQGSRPGYYRKVHCLKNSDGWWEGWSWVLHQAGGPGRGVFEAVEFP